MPQVPQWHDATGQLTPLTRPSRAHDNMWSILKTRCARSERSDPAFTCLSKTSHRLDRRLTQQKNCFEMNDDETIDSPYRQWGGHALYTALSERVNRVERPTRHIFGHFEWGLHSQSPRKVRLQSEPSPHVHTLAI